MSLWVRAFPPSKARKPLEFERLSIHVEGAARGQTIRGISDNVNPIYELSPEVCYAGVCLVLP